MKVHQDFMGWSCMQLVWHGTLVQKEPDGTLQQELEQMGTLQKLQCGTFADLRIIGHTVAV